MRIAVMVLALGLAACATGASEPGAELGPSPFPVERGAAPPPPAQSARQAAPPEGRAGGGVDFGQWRSADPASYAPQFQAQMRQRFSGRDRAQIRADLEANGFACEDAQRLDCRIEIMERDCAVDWYVVVERARPEPIAGFDRMCLGAR
ncbi:MAG: hypothetical protein KJZ75_09965 [Hyphomonadaceae bacterium]|nr:hypothetical protein [Hyphomonadaceae bacterium]